MEHRTSWQAHSSRVNQDIPWVFFFFFWNLRFINAFPNDNQLSVSSARPIQSMPPPSHFLNIHFNIMLSMPRSSKWSLYLVSLCQNTVHLSCPTFLHMPKWEGVVETGWSWLSLGMGGEHLWEQWWTFWFQQFGYFLD